LCSSNASFGSKAVDFERTALDLDLRENGLPVFPDEIGKRQVVKLKGPVVLQIQKVKNVSAPKASPDSGHSPRLLRLQLTDGHRTFSALEVSPIPQLSLSLAPGTKVRLTGKEMEIVKGFIMIGPSDISVLGGRVEKLASKWELTQSLAKQTRQTDDEGSPPFVPFGKKIPGKHSAAVSSDKTGRSAKPLHTTKPPQEKTEDRPKIDPSSLATFDSKETQMPCKDGNVAHLVEMGFSLADSTRALQKCRGDPEAAIDLLTRGSSAKDQKQPLHSDRAFGAGKERGRQSRPHSSPVSESQVEVHYPRGQGHIQGRSYSQRSRGRYVQRKEHEHEHRRGYYSEDQWSHSSHQQSTMGNDYYFDSTYSLSSQSRNPEALDFGSFPTTYYNSQRRGQTVPQRRGKQRRVKQLDSDPRGGMDLSSSLTGLLLNEGDSCYNQDSSRNGRMSEFPRQPKPSAALAEAIRKETKPSN
jgi:tudor domain-containing protein 3